MVSDWVTGATGKYGEKHHVHSALNSSFVAESKVGNWQKGRVINFIKYQYWEIKGKAIATCRFKTL